MWKFPRRTRYADCNGSEASEETEIAVNIGGVKHILYGDVLNRYPETRLAELVNRATDSTREDLSALCDDYDDLKREFYFDRDPEAFKCILELYFYGKIHMKGGICPMYLKRELDYWGIDVEHLGACCKSHLNEVETMLAQIAEKVKAIQNTLKEDAMVTRGQRCRASLRNLIGKPKSSLAARVIGIVSVAFILLSTVVMCLSTMPELQVQDAEDNLIEHPIIHTIETACISWFTVKYILRFVSSSNNLRFMTSFMNIIDFITIMPFYLVLILETAMMDRSNVQQAARVLRVIRIAMRVMRIARVFKLAHHSSGLRTLAIALKSSLKEMSLVLIYMSVGVFLFSALGYIIEESHPESMFTSIPMSFWWAVNSMSTVGYGDIYPQTTLGKCNAAVSVVFGMLAIMLPLQLIIKTFGAIYNNQHELEIIAKREIELTELRAEDEVKGCQEAGKMPSQASSKHSM
ncbi:voltage-gated potassium channel regulatory subunit KCNF1-like [Siphateles boraxobius]|uniref:voltage-gated potassium channel regulatory subunit KCNF1-like n=1 Tax=Siphateles boraxobius TaxID=180520 RepID=UPI004063A162